MENLFLQLGYNWADMLEEEEIDIADKNIKIKSWDTKTKQIVFKTILTLIRKSDDYLYEVYGSRNNLLLKATGGHRIYDANLETWVSLFQIDSTTTLLNDGSKEKVSVFKTNILSPVLDITVEDTSNYFSNGLLSHNTTSGNALKYYASQRLDIRRTGAIKRGEEIIGNETRIKVVKNKVAPPFREVEVRIIYGKGLDYNTDLLRLAVSKDIVKRSGAWYSFQEEKLGQGEQNTTEYLQSNPELAKKIETLVLEDMRSQQPELSNGPDLLQTSEEIIQ